MGKHYVPRAHLRRFAVPESPDFVWMYDRKTARFQEAAISKVAQQPGFYAEDVEKGLAETIETPGNVVIDKLRRRERLNNAERTSLPRVTASSLPIERLRVRDTNLIQRA